MTDTKTVPNAALIAELKTALAMAEAGSITNGVLIAAGAKVYHRTFSVPKPEDMPMMCGEVGMFLTEMQLIVMGGRTAQEENRKNFLQPGAGRLSS